MAETLRYLLQTKAARGTRLVTSAAVACNATAAASHLLRDNPSAEWVPADAWIS
jgi:hypothetical protein